MPSTFFETRIRPLLAANCYACHGESAMAGLRVDSREGLLRGGETGPAIVPGDPEKSALLKAVQHADGFPRMPRGRAKLAAADIDALAEWIRAGAVWPVGRRPRRRRRSRRTSASITAEQRAFWAFQPLAKPARARACGRGAGRAPTSIASSSRVSSAKAWRRSAPPTS